MSRSAFKLEIAKPTERPSGLTLDRTDRADKFPRFRSVNRQKEYALQVLVRDNNIDQALRVLKKKMQREGLFREMKQRQSYEKPSERKTREKSEAVRRARKLARKKAQREGLIADPKKKKLLDDKKKAFGQRPGMSGGTAGGMSGGPRPPRDY
jgi:small subunit ribosomal protein S21